MKPVTHQPLPRHTQMAYNPELQEFRYLYENGGMMVHGNNLSPAYIPIQDVVAYLSEEVRRLNDELETIRSQKDEPINP